METAFTSEEITILLKALDAWEHEATSGAMMGSMLGMAILKECHTKHTTHYGPR